MLILSKLPLSRNQLSQPQYNQLVYGVTNKDLREKLLSAAYNNALDWTKVADIVNNKFQQPQPQMRTNQVTRQQQWPPKAKQQQNQKTCDYQSASGGERASPATTAWDQAHATDLLLQGVPVLGLPAIGNLERACCQRPPVYGGKQRFETASSSQAMRGMRYIASTINTQLQQSAATGVTNNTERLKSTAPSSQQPPQSGEQRRSEKDFGLFSISRDDWMSVGKDGPIDPHGRSSGHPLSRLVRLYVYALHGCLCEVVFTAIWDWCSTQDRRLAGHSSLWSLPMYSIAIYVMENLRAWLLAQHQPPPVRLIAYTLFIYFWEFSWGAGLTLLRACPWDYSGYRYNLRGLVTLEYVLPWAMAAFIAEQHVIKNALRLRLHS